MGWDVPDDDGVLGTSGEKAMSKIELGLCKAKRSEAGGYSKVHGGEIESPSLIS
jgi:hypothetical protein